MSEIDDTLERLKVLKPLADGGKLNPIDLMRLAPYLTKDKALKDAEYLDKHLPDGDPRRPGATKLLEILRKTLK